MDQFSSYTDFSSDDLVTPMHYYNPSSYGFEYDQQCGLSQDSCIDSHSNTFGQDFYYNFPEPSKPAEMSYYYKNDVTNYVPQKNEYFGENKVKQEFVSCSGYQTNTGFGYEYLQPYPGSGDEKSTSCHVKSLSQLCPPYSDVLQKNIKTEG